MIPVGASLKDHGASKGAVASFLLSTPQTGVDSILVTYSLLGWVFAVYRVVVAFITGILGGWIIDRFTDGSVRSDSTIAPAQEIESAAENTPTNSPHPTGQPPSVKLKRGLRYGLYSLPQDIGGPLVIGLLIAALIGSLFASGSLAQSALGSGILPMLLMMVVGIPMYVCATASVPIAAALIIAGVSPGAALVFLVAGPATNAATITTIWKILGRASAIAYLCVVGVGALAAGALLNLLLRNPAISTTMHAHQELLPAWFSQASAVALLVVLGVALWPRRKKVTQASAPDAAEKLTLKIDGMTCTHCAAAVQRALEATEGVQSAEVSLEEKRAVVAGKGLDVAKLVAAVDAIGYKASAA